MRTISFVFSSIALINVIFNYVGLRTINYVFYLDFLVFGLFATLLFTEIMGSVVLIFWWKKYHKAVLPYIIPVWEVTGTFGALWVVLSDFAFPPILIPLAQIFAAAIMIFLIFFVARNVSIAFGEFIVKKKWLDERKLYTGYALSSLLIGIVVLYVLAGIIGGYGVDLSTMTINLGTWFSHAADILFVVGAVIILVGLAPVFYGAKELGKAGVLLTVIGVAISSVSMVLFNPAGLSWVIAFPIILTIIPPLGFLSEKLRPIVSNKLVFIIWATVAIFTLNFAVYPSAFGGAVSVDAVTTSGPMKFAYFSMTLVGGIILGILVALYVVAWGRRNRATNTSS